MTDNFTAGDVDVRNVASCETNGGTPDFVQRIDDLEAVRDYIDHIDFVTLKEKLTSKEEEGGLGWSANNADHTEARYKRWLFLKRKYEGELIPPPKDIDAFWHGHILDTIAYHRDTAAIFGKYLQHYPYFGRRGKADHEKLLSAFENTKQHYRKEYGEELTGNPSL